MAERIVCGVTYKPIPGFSRYDAGSDGTIWSWRCSGHATHSRLEPRQVRPTPRRGGYLGLSLVDDAGEVRSVAVHRMVLLAFTGPCPNGMEACHNNGIRTDCRIENLRWDTHASNHADKRIHGTHQAGELHGCHKLTEGQVVQIKEGIIAGRELVHMARQYGVDPTTIGCIWGGKTWRHIAPELNAKFPPRQKRSPNGTRKPRSRKCLSQQMTR